MRQVAGSFLTVTIRNCVTDRESAIFSYILPWHYTGLIIQFTVREFRLRYRQSWLGALWVVLTPILMLGVYTVVFRHVLRLRWGTSDGSDLVFALRIYAGLAVFSFFSECILRAPRLILDQPHLVKKVVFPLEILPWVSTLTALVHLGVAACILLALAFWENAGLPLSAVALPLVWLPLLPLSVGAGWLLSALGTYVHDVGQALGLAVSMLLFLSPVFYGVESLPDGVRGWIFLNPLALTMTQTREVLLDGIWPDWFLWARQLSGCLLWAWLGAIFFKRTRAGFADVV